MTFCLGSVNQVYNILLSFCVEIRNLFWGLWSLTLTIGTKYIWRNYVDKQLEVGTCSSFPLVSANVSCMAEGLTECHQPRAIASQLLHSFFSV